MLEIIVKRDGTEETLDAKKANNWLIWAGHDIADRIDWSTIVMSVVKESPEKMTSQDFQLALVRKCKTFSDWPHSLMAGRLYSVWNRKQFYGDTMPKIQHLHLKLANMGLMKTMAYTDEEYAEIEALIDHQRDFQLAHFQVQQDIYKYGICNRVTREFYETPQYIFMRMAMGLAEGSPAEERMDDIKGWYNSFTTSRVNAPTPNFTNLGTEHSGFSSCCLYKAGDTARSLGVGDHIAYTMTYMSAGIGGYIESRSKLDWVRGGSVEHQGKAPYFQSVAKATRANRQGARGGACTQYITVFDPEVEDIMRIQNPRTPVEVQNRDIHFAVMYNSFFAKKVHAREKFFTFNVKTAPDLHKALFSSDRVKFAELYEKYEKDPNFKKNYLDAWDVCVLMESEGHAVSTLYTFDIEEANRHTTFLDPIHSSNLCIEVSQPTQEYEHIMDLYTEGHERGEISLCNLGAIVVSRIETDEEYEEAAYRAVKMADTTIDMNYYEFPHLRYTATRRRNISIGMIGIAEYFAKRGIKFDTPYGLEMADKLAERHAYFVTKASLRLAKERGVAEWMHKTKWPQGWLFIDTYKKNVDKLTPFKMRYDWEGLRAEIIALGGIRNSSLIAHMPTESSSKSSGAPNGPYPVRDLGMKKTDAGNSIDWVAVDGDLYGEQYQIAYDIDTIDLIKYYAVLQKWADQSISADFYMDRVKKPTLTEKELVGHFMARVMYGVKGKYYQNSLTSQVDDLDKISLTEAEHAIQQAMSMDPSAPIIGANARADCGPGGSCTL